ncbi:Peptidyl-prolyl cis-trans isomerase pin4 [Sporothrix eucalyptigena]|uniref:Peptidyl-prolyl cis-trans isomerase pin4 n=1 Tax=Sporothrix eucalyptigena TaxID=1812306 RepID=A0ABP0BNI0_9PEZI
MNTQQPQGDYYSGYPMSHSPNPTRPGYATISGLNGGRRSQPSGDNLPGQQTSSLFSDDRFASFDPVQRFDRTGSAQSNLQSGLQSTLQPPGAYNMFNSTNQSAWNYNGASAATLGGPMTATMTDGSRIRASSRRPALHPEWTTNEPPMGNPNGHSLPFYSSQQHLVGQQGLGLPSTSSPDPFTVQPPSVNLPSYGPPEIRTMSDTRKDMGDLIPTAIVIKNIPFNIRKEYLTSVMIDLHLPQPYAFNYHFDQGVFRGLAFANFQSANDTKLVIERMNGLDIQGRKLRVEYKKMLPEHERERIEREKREKRGQLEEQHRGPAHQISISSMATAASAQRAPVNEVSSRIDLNDPNILRLYIDLYMFHNDDSREVYIFPADTPPEDRRHIHILAHNMGLEHTSIGEGDNRQVHVSKSKFATPGGAGRQPPSVQQPGINLESHPRGLSRAATYDFTERQNQHPSIHSMSNRGPTLAIPNSPENHQHGGMNVNVLRGVKSFADLRSFSPSPSPSLVSSAALGNPTTNGGHSAGGGNPFLHYPGDGPFGPSLATPTTPGAGINAPSSVDTSGLVNSLGSLGLGSSSFDGSGLPGRSRETPGAIGAIGSQRPSANGNSNANGNGVRTAIPERQPRGPGDWESAGAGAGGFSRGRTNGHMQRSSGDSSDNSRLPHGSSLYQ